ncbi:MAG: T9SS type A sorting domain-containing protein [Bacteroidota bacterium]|jgi:Secretion system C-terminal sorting domain
MMRRISLLLLGTMAVLISPAQNTPGPKPQVSKCIYFDVSPPLRDMIKTPQTKADMSWKDGIVLNHLRRTDQPGNASSGVDNMVQNYHGINTTDTLLASFDGANNTNSVAPPDCDGDVGPNHYIQVVNCHFSIFDKAGNLLIGPVNNTAMFTGLYNNVNSGDAVVLYDEVENRWIFTQFSLPNYPAGPFFEMVAVSATGDPLGQYYRYQFQFTYMPDYPKLGVWPDGIYMSSNNFSGGGGVGTGAACFNKAEMYEGNPTARMVYFSLPSSNEAWAVLPSDCDGTYPPLGTPNFFSWLANGHIRIYGFHVDWTTTANSTYTQLVTIPVAAYSGYVQDIPQKGTSFKLDAISGRLMFRLPFRNFGTHWSMVCNSTVNVNGHAGIRWWELQNTGANPANWTIYQESTYSPDNNGRWMGSIAIDSLNNIALGFSLSGDNKYPSVYYTGRQVSDPLNTMSVAEAAIIDGGGSQTCLIGGRPRWGDYSAMNADPVVPGKFWYTQEYYKTSTASWAWWARVGAFAFGNNLMATAFAVPAIMYPFDTVHLNVTVTGGSGNYTYSWSSNPTGFTSTQKNPWVRPLLGTTYTVQVSDGIHTFTSNAPVIVQDPAIAVPSVICNGDSSHLNVLGSGGGSYTYSWTSVPPGFTSVLRNPWVHPSVNTTYNVVISQGSNSANGSVELPVQSGPSVNAGNDTTYCNYVPVFTVHGTASGFDESLWSTLGDGHFDNPMSLIAPYHPGALDKQNGVTLILQIHPVAPCYGLRGDTVKIHFDPCTGVNSLASGDPEIQIQPNPSNGLFEFTVQNCVNMTADVSVTDLLGHMVFQAKYEPQGTTLRKKLDLSSLSKGCYMMTVSTANGRQVKSIIISGDR